MEKVTVLFFVVLMFGCVLAEGEWGDINENDSGEVATEDVSVSSSEVVSDTASTSSISTGEADTLFTENFYYALAVVLVALLIVGLFIWLWLRGSKNKWD